MPEPSLSSERRVQQAAGRYFEQVLRTGAEAYDRGRDLPALIRLDPLAPIGDDRRTAENIVARLERALRAERSRARAGHWTYDLNRHIALRQAHRAETERLAALRRAHPAQASVNSVIRRNTGRRIAPDQSM